MSKQALLKKIIPVLVILLGLGIAYYLYIQDLESQIQSLESKIKTTQQALSVDKNKPNRIKDYERILDRVRTFHEFMIFRHTPKRYQDPQITCEDLGYHHPALEEQTKIIRYVTDIAHHKEQLIQTKVKDEEKKQRMLKDISEKLTLFKEEFGLEDKAYDAKKLCVKIQNS